MKIIDKSEGNEDNTSPELSRQIAKFLTSEIVLSWTPEQRFVFLDRVTKAENFTDLSQDDQDLVLGKQTKANPDHDERGRFGSGSHTVTEAKVLSFEEMLAHPVIDKLLSGEMSLASTKKQVARVLGALYETQGFDGKPEVVSEEQLQTHIASGYPDMYRGLSGDDGEEHAEAYRNGEYYPGKGLYGNGTYTAYGDKAKQSVKGEEGYGETVMHLSLQPQAKVINYDDLLENSNDLYDTIETKMKDAPPETVKRLDKLQRLISDPGYYAVLHGIDAIDVKSMKYMVVLNRTATKVASKEE